MTSDSQCNPCTALVEFVGGPADGGTMEVPTHYMGRPPHQLRIAVEPTVTLNYMDQADPTYLEPYQVLYECVGVMSDDTHRWPYIWSPAYARLLRARHE